MTKEQRERVEDALISMIENVPSMNNGAGGEPKAVSADCMKAAAEVTYALIALQESATPVAPNMRVGNTVGFVEATPRRGITVETPKREDGD